ncbi:MAG TPA: DUF5719 family protein [Candidatus Nanopelagicaceae bacterium]|nr:DUF5719 family protein [Candidatus Nanopelagicaceae bacterium]
MRWRLLVIFLVIVTGLSVVQARVSRTFIEVSRIATEAPSIICPASAHGATIALNGENISVSPLGKLPKGVKDRPFTTSDPVTSRPVSGNPHIVDNSSGGITQLDSTSAVSGLKCPSVDTSYWFVGGSAALNSQDQLILSNASHGDATATILAWSDKGPVPTYPVVVPAQSGIRVGLDSVAPGVSALAIHVLVQSGRVAASLFDQRSQGLTQFGADYVPPGIEPAKNFVLLGVPQTPIITAPISKSKKKTSTSTPVSDSRVLRLLSPRVDASVRVDVSGAGDFFTPLGLDHIELKAGVVKDITVTAALASSVYSFVVTADSPVVAGVFSSIALTGGSDIAWTASTPVLSSDAIDASFNGTHYTFFSPIDASVQVSATGASPTPTTQVLVIPANTVVSWAPKKSTTGVIGVRIHPVGKSIYAASLFRSNSGLTTSPIRSLSMTGKSTMAVPQADVGVGMPR